MTAVTTAPKSADSAAIEGSSGSPKGFSWKRGGLVMIFLCLSVLLQGATYSHITSFFNVYALEVKGISSAAYGIIMGSYCFVVVFVTPLTAKLVSLKYFRDKTLLFIAWIIDSSFCLLMSLVYKLGRGNPFFLGSLTLRIFEACGCAMGCMMVYVIVGLELNEINHIVIPILETIYGVSVVVGPAVSGILFDVGGFPLPFWFMGGTLMALTMLGLSFFPEPRKLSPEDPAPDSVSIWTAWEFPVIVNVLCAMNAFVLISFNESTLALQLNIKFGMSATESGMLFLFAGGTYALSSLVFGFVSKRILDPRYFVLIGQIISLVALTLQGPLIPVRQSKEILILAQILLGIGSGPCYVCSYIQSLRYLSKGKESKELYAALTAIFTPATSVGCTIGPLMAGFILDYYSYETVVAVNVSLTVAVAILLFCTICMGTKTFKETDQANSADRASVSSAVVKL
ncbi:MFS-type transporter SLC18B1-like [Galendromus occidentalis]|uniref:MFS-type transporter SLC18B1-like n=1 Tax=Galendromus occidentalis TaxID=34638 RepID=A0AAJ6VW37_9ACAR|nr:MFS-type transporter SLC18B1-like [Galendromus occidentalis]